MTKNIFLNGRFLTRPLSGVQRTALELIQALDTFINSNPDILTKFSFTIVYSGTIVNEIKLKHITLSKRGFATGIMWEQLELPFITRKGFLISLCSISTLFKRNQFVMVHDASFFVNEDFFSKNFVKWYKFAIPILGKISKKILTVSQFSKSELVKYARFKPDKVDIIYNSADHILKYSEPSQEFIIKIDSLRPYCLAVSNLGLNKNFGGLSQALNKMNFAPYNMLIAGGRMKGLNANELNDQHSVTYLGYVSDNELKYLYQNSSLFLFPSFYEGFGIPPLEAMALGCPVIASNTSSLPEVLNDAAAYFNPFDVDDMAHQIQVLLNDNEQLATLKEKGYRQAARYSWHKSAEQLYKLIQKYA